MGQRPSAGCIGTAAGHGAQFQRAGCQRPAPVDPRAARRQRGRPACAVAADGTAPPAPAAAPVQAHAQLGLVNLVILVNLGEARVLAGEFARLRLQRATARQRRAGPTPAFHVWRLSPSPVESLALGLRSNVNEAWLLARINHPWPLAPQRLPGWSPAFLQCIDWMLQPRPADPSQSAAALREALDACRPAPPASPQMARTAGRWETSLLMDPAAGPAHQASMFDPSLAPSTVRVRPAPQVDHTQDLPRDTPAAEPTRLTPGPQQLIEQRPRPPAAVQAPAPTVCATSPRRRSRQRPGADAGRRPQRALRGPRAGGLVGLRRAAMQDRHQPARSSRMRETAARTVSQCEPIHPARQ